MKSSLDRTAEGASPGAEPEGIDAPEPRRLPEPGPDCSTFLIWQLADSALPTGGFAHSAGLEAAYQSGEVRNKGALEAWLRAGVGQLTYSTLPFVNATHSAPELLGRYDMICEAYTSNHVANRASRAQGRALLSLCERAFLQVESSIPRMEKTQWGHFAPVFGFVAARLGIDATTARRLFAFQHLRGAIAAAVRLNIIGPMEAQSLQYRLSREALSAADQAAAVGIGDAAQTAPILDLLQGNQDRLTSRLFQS